jgi:hypothetical protein
VDGDTHGEDVAAPDTETTDSGQPDSGPDTEVDGADTGDGGGDAPDAGMPTCVVGSSKIGGCRLGSQ